MSKIIKNNTDKDKNKSIITNKNKKIGNISSKTKTSNVAKNKKSNNSVSVNKVSNKKLLSNDSTTLNNNKVINDIKNIIKTKIRPILVMDGGNIEFVEYKNKIVSVKLLGACNGCPLATITLKNTVKLMIKEAVPEVEDVEAIDFTEEELE